MGREIKDGEMGWMALFGSVFMLGALVITGFFAGLYIGTKLNHREFGVIIGVLLFSVIGFYDIFRVAIRVMKRADRISAEKKAEKEVESTKKELSDVTDNSISDKMNKIISDADETFEIDDKPVGGMVDIIDILKNDSDDND